MPERALDGRQAAARQQRAPGRTRLRGRLARSAGGCVGDVYLTSSSSISNTSVEFGGMRGGAPRAP